ncbi:MAG: YitT family protein [Dorea sp.]
MKDKLMKKRIVMCVVGVLICGVSVGFFKRAALGVDPFQSFMSGLDALIPIEFGTLYVIANVCLLLFSLIADRHYIGLATIINLTLLGYVAQYTLEFLQYVFPNLSLVGQLVFLVIGIILSCFSASLYFVADLGVSTYDAIALVITETWKIGKFKYVRVITDFSCVAIGTILYFIATKGTTGLTAIVGIGTIVTAFFMGPLIDVFSEKISKPMLYGKN